MCTLVHTLSVLRVYILKYLNTKDHKVPHKGHKGKNTTYSTFLDSPNLNNQGYGHLNTEYNSLKVAEYYTGTVGLLSII